MVLEWSELHYLLPQGPEDGESSSSGKVAAPDFGNFEACGRAYHQYQFPQGDVEEEEDEAEMLMEGPEMDALRAKLHKKNLDLEDYYALLALEEFGVDATDKQIRSNFKKISLICHPDKALPADRSYAEKRFKAIQKAFDTLTTKIKRIGYDSQLPFDETIPGEKDGDTDATFFQVYAPVFQRNGRFSMNKPVPPLGDMNTPYEQVNSFYDYWFGLKSWRDFTYLDEHKPDDSTGRDEKRHMERQNQKLRAGKKKEETARVRKLVEMAMSKDPRVKKKRLEEDEQKALKKVEKSVRAKQKAEDDAAFASAVKKKQAEAEEAALREKEEFKKKQEEAKKLRSTFKKLCKAERAGPFDAEAVQTLAAESSVERLRLLIGALSLKADTKEPLTAEEIKQARDLFDSELAQRQAEQAEKARLAAEAVALAKMEERKAQEQGKNANRGWSLEEEAVLARAMVKFVGGVSHRWELICEMLNHANVGPTRNTKEVIKKAKDDEVAKKTSSTQAFDLYQSKVLKKKVDLEERSAILGDAGGGPRFEAKVKGDTELTSEDRLKFAKKAEEFLVAVFGGQKVTFTEAERKGSQPMASLPDYVDFGLGCVDESSPPPPVVVHAVESEWNSDQQAAFEAALKSTPKEVEDRWEVIASKVPGKTKKDCVKRFKEIREKIMAAKAK
jgi:DnaJ family protein C protein 2